MQHHQKIKLMVGLGNPGKEYENTYHNAGFLFVDSLSETERQILDVKCYKSNVFMNESGLFVRKSLKKTGVKPEELLVIQDDSDLEIGSHRFSYGRGSAGHRGVESIIKILKTKNFWRLRIGIRPVNRMRHIDSTDTGLSSPKPQQARTSPPTETRRTKAGDFVLKKISKANLVTLRGEFEKAREKITGLVEGT